jgi:hypothetical protein
MYCLNFKEKNAFLKLFIRFSNVLDFDKETFDDFTLESIKIPLSKHYGLSSRKSFEKFLKEGNNNLINKLLIDLLEYYEFQVYFSEDMNNFALTDLYAICDEIRDHIKHFEFPILLFPTQFSTEYIFNQTKIMYDMISTNPTESIGKSKELIESCCTTILKDNSILIDSSLNLSQLVKKTMILLKISVEDVDGTEKIGKIAKAILGNLSGISSKIAELRNLYGSGHGKFANFRALSERHARLAVGCSVTLVNYLWDIHELRNNNFI